MPDTILLELPQKSFRPGDTINGSILWEFRSRPESISVNLGWWTSGRGDRDEWVVTHHTWKSPFSIGKESFELAIPHSVIPSFSGRLISVEWGVQASAKGVTVEDAVETFLLSPINREIDISGQTYESKGKSLSFRKGRALSVSNRR